MFLKQYCVCWESSDSGIYSSMCLSVRGCTFVIVVRVCTAQSAYDSITDVSFNGDNGCRFLYRQLRSVHTSD